MSLPPAPSTPEELSDVLGLIIADYVKRHGHTPRTRVEVLGALEDAKAHAYNNPRQFGASN